MFHSLPILLGKLPAIHWQHYALLVMAMHILLKDKISINEINAAEVMIKHFCEIYLKLYGEHLCYICMYDVVRMYQYTVLSFY